MFKSKIYTNHFPLNYYLTSFSENEKKVLRRWAATFKTEVRVRKMEIKRKQRSTYFSYNVDEYNSDIMISMINNNRFNEVYLIYLNAIIYRHKYNGLISMFIFPVMDKQ